MTIPALPEKLTPVINYVVQGSENQFTFKFLVVNDDDMYVYQNGVQIPQRNYTITGINNDAGGEVTINTTLNPLSIGDVITLSRFTLPEQLTEFLRLGDFTAEAVNAEFTRIYQLLQEFRRDISENESETGKLQEQISENREDIDKLGSLSAAAFKGVKEWKQGEQVTDRFQRYFYPNPTQGEPSYTWSAPLASNSNPITMGASPIGDDNWQTWDVSRLDLTIAQEEILGEKIYKGSNGVGVEVGDLVPSSAVYLLVKGKIKAMLPSSNGEVTAINEEGAKIGGVSVEWWSPDDDGKLYVKDFMQRGFSFDGAVQECIDLAEANCDTINTFSKSAVPVVIPKGIYHQKKPWLVYNPDYFVVIFEDTQITIDSELIPDLSQKWLDLPNDYSVKRGMFIVAKRRQTGGPDGNFIPGGVSAAPRYLNFKGNLQVFCPQNSPGYKKNYFIDSYGLALSTLSIDVFHIRGMKKIIGAGNEKVYRVINTGNIEMEYCVGIEDSDGGTTRQWNALGLTYCDEGYKLRNISYSQFSNSGCDAWGFGEYGWDFENCLNVTLVGCGMEKGYGGAVRAVGERCTVNAIGCNIAAGALPNAGNWSGSDTEAGQDSPSDFGVTRMSDIQGAHVNMIGCSVRQQYTTQNRVQYEQNPVIRTFPFRITDVTYGNNKKRKACVNITDVSGDEFADECVDLFPSTEGGSTISIKDSKTTLGCTLERSVNQQIGQNASEKVEFNNPISDQFGIYDSATFITTLKHGGRVNVSGQLFVTGYGLNYIALVIAGKDSPIFQGVPASSEWVDVAPSFSHEFDAVAGDEIYITVRSANTPQTALVISEKARLQVTYK